MAKREKKFTISVSFSEEKMTALQMYLKEKDSDLELEMSEFLDKLYAKTVPGSIRSYLSAKEKIEEKAPAEPSKPEPQPEEIGDDF